MGVPISPDTSFIVAEMLLSSVDEEFCEEMERAKLKPNGYRSFDDFEFGFTTQSDAETAVSILQRVLGDYELQLNPGKTDIVELPIPLESTWSSELRTFKFDDRVRTWDLRRYFDRAFELSIINRDREVLKYAIQRLRSVEIAKDGWKLFQDLLLQCAMVEPSALPAVVDRLHFYRDKDLPLNIAKISAVFNLLLGLHAPLRHGSEVAWTLWACLLFQIQIKDVSASAVSEMEDSFAALLLLHAQDSGLVSGRVESQNWQMALTSDGLGGSQWLLSYEATIKGWLRSEGDHVSDDRQFGRLKEHMVSFYDAGKVSSHAASKCDQPPLGRESGGGY